METVRVWHAIWCDYIRDEPHILLKWHESMSIAQFETRTVPIDPSKLNRIGWKDAQFQYEFPVELHLP